MNKRKATVIGCLLEPKILAMIIDNQAAQNGKKQDAASLKIIKYI